jgi:hypothetical protein
MINYVITGEQFDFILENLGEIPSKYSFHLIKKFMEMKSLESQGLSIVNASVLKGMQDVKPVQPKDNADGGDF